MPETIRVNEEIGIIEIVSYDEISRQDLEGSKAKLQQLYEKHGFNKVLI
ncbi:MAG: hypothetical protein ACKVH8_19615 [Pirellulales bacterium]